MPKKGKKGKKAAAEEATAELVAALAADDKVAFSRLLLTQKELDDLQLGTKTSEKIRGTLESAGKAFDLYGQATKGAWGMSWHQEALKGVEDCEKPG